MQGGNVVKGLKILMLLLLAFGFLELSAQESEVIGSVEFEHGLVQVGRPTRLLMEITHPEDVVVIFPDSAKDFGPWEVARTEVTPTRSNAGISIDYKSFYIRTFELDSVQYIELPFYYLIGSDTVTRYTNSDSIEFDPVIEILSDTLQMKAHLGLTYVTDPPNFLMWVILSSLGLVFLVLLAFAAYKPVVRKIKVWRLTREWEKVQKKMKEMEGKLGNQEIFIGDLNSAWKQYLDKDRRKAFRSLTSTELEEVLLNLEDVDLEDKSILNDASKSLDMVIYAGIKYPEAKMQQLLNDVFRIMEKEFNRRKGGVSA